MTTYLIRFTCNGETVRVWEGYTSYEDARRALSDADMIIPFQWDSSIEESTE